MPLPHTANCDNICDMPHEDHLQYAYPTLGRSLGKLALASLPTPVRELPAHMANGERRLFVKLDNLTGTLYGGNKVRKLEYILHVACAKKRRTIATFGAAGSHHALATALYARQLGMASVSLLSQQARTPAVAATLNMLIENDSEIIPYGGDYGARIETLRRHLWNRDAWVVPAGGSSWRGTLGFINAALELADQVARGECAAPDRLYVATGTMGTAVGLALGFALAGLRTEVHAVRVSHTYITSQEKIDRLGRTTAGMLHHFDRSIPANLASRTHLCLRHEFFAGGYARADEITREAITRAAREFDLDLEPTYTGKAMAAMLHDMEQTATRGMTLLFWHSYHAAALPVPADVPLHRERVPREFLRYFR